MVILDLSNPQKPIAIDQRATIGPAIDLDVVFRGSSFADKATGVNRPFYFTRIYVAMGSDGVQVITISPISKAPSKLDKDKHTIKNKGYSKVIYYDTEDRVLAITEAHYAGMNEFVFIADGNDGVKVLDLSTA